MLSSSLGRGHEAEGLSFIHTDRSIFEQFGRSDALWVAAEAMYQIEKNDSVHQCKYG